MAARAGWAGIDRDELVLALNARGVDARLDESADGGVIEIPCDDTDSRRACVEMLRRVEALLAELGVPFVVEQGDGAVYVRPPAA